MDEKPWYKKSTILGLLGVITLIWGSMFLQAEEPTVPPATQQAAVVESIKTELNLDAFNIEETQPVNVPVKEKKATAPAPTQSCNSNYSGCLKRNAGDYDCRGGSGNGPNYTGAVRVLGYDEYGLDRDNDGWGCE